MSKAKRTTAGERVARDFVGPHPTLARRINTAIRLEVKARDARWRKGLEHYLCGDGTNAMYVRGNIIDFVVNNRDIVTTPKAAPGKRGNITALRAAGGGA